MHRTKVLLDDAVCRLFMWSREYSSERCNLKRGPQPIVAACNVHPKLEYASSELSRPKGVLKSKYLLMSLIFIASRCHESDGCDTSAGYHHSHDYGNYRGKNKPDWFMTVPAVIRLRQSKDRSPDRRPSCWSQQYDKQTRVM